MKRKNTPKQFLYVTITTTNSKFLEILKLRFTCLPSLHHFHTRPYIASTLLISWNDHLGLMPGYFHLTSRTQLLSNSIKLHIHGLIIPIMIICVFFVFLWMSYIIMKTKWILTFRRYSKTSIRTPCLSDITLAPKDYVKPVCKFNQTGFCRFGKNCNKMHVFAQIPNATKVFARVLNLRPEEEKPLSRKITEADSVV